jgi:C4-dicarboxylate transporter DctQ subunit
VGQTLLIVVTFMGLSYCAKQARHITMSVVFDLVNYRFKKAFVCIVLFFSALAMIYFTYLGSLYVLKVHSLGRVTPALRIPIYIIYSTVPLGLLLCAIEYIRAFIINVKSKEVYLSSEKTLRADEEKQPAQGICSTDEKSACISREEG